MIIIIDLISSSNLLVLPLQAPLLLQQELLLMLIDHPLLIIIEQLNQLKERLVEEEAEEVELLLF
jgi:hypothetical protein